VTALVPLRARGLAPSMDSLVYQSATTRSYGIQYKYTALQF